jgi:hypothetical protein
MSGRNALIALVAALAVALVWSLAGLSVGIGQAAAAVAAFVVVWLLLAVQARRSAKPVMVEAAGEQAAAMPDLVPPEQRALLTRVTSALADQHRAFDDTEKQLGNLRTVEQRLLAQRQQPQPELTNEYRLATVRSQIEQLERLLGVIATNIVALQTQRGAIQTTVAAHVMPSPQMVLEIQSQLQQAQTTLAIADEGTRAIHELTADLSDDRSDLIGDLVGDPQGGTTPLPRRQPVAPLAEPEM